MTAKELSTDDKTQLAVALILLGDWKSEGKFNPGVTLMVLDLAKAIGVDHELNVVRKMMPPMKIVPR